ncbi:MAG TPA: efflux transporter outer membrane subunit [Candidatus Binataceae bacterium]|nr:efflux transporter outer membrane subunit [Candidatus Binataceae bacterium]
MFTSLNNSSAGIWRFLGRLLTLSAAVLSFTLDGCAVGPNFMRPKEPTTQRYTYEKEPESTITADDGEQHFKLEAKIAADWWRLFNCSKLNVAVMQAVENSPTMQAAQAALRQSEDNLRAGYGIFYPQLGASFEPTRQQFSPARFGESSGPSLFNLYTLSTTVSYVLDVWGGERRTIEGLGAQVDVEYYNAQGTYLTLSGNVVNAIVAEAAYAAEIGATQRILGFLAEQTQITAAQVRAGMVPYSNLLSIQSQLATSEAALPPLQQQLAHTRHLLAILIGAAPADVKLPEVTFAELTLPEELPVSLPADLVRQRPDVLTAESQLHYASAQIGVATAAMLPSFTLNANYGLNSTSLSSLFGSTAAFWTLGAAIASPLIQGPTLWYQRKAAIDAYQQALANYRQTVLAALAQVADALDALQHDAESVRAESEALSAASETLRLIQANYRAGTVNYLQVLIADYQYQQASLGYIQALGQRLQDTAALFLALGGGWWNGQEQNLGLLSKLQASTKALPLDRMLQQVQ